MQKVLEHILDLLGERGEKARRGGVARAKALSAKRRREIARLGGKAKAARNKNGAK